MRLSFPVLAVLAAALLAPRASAAPAPALCQDTASLALLSMDTNTGRMLFYLTAEGGARLLEVLVEEDGAWLRAAPPGAPRFAGSMGPGPLFALSRCGDGCVQPELWQGEAWKPLGDSLALPRRANLYTTYDRDGDPWVIVNLPGVREGWVETHGYHLENRRWQHRGGLEVSGVTAQGAAPAAWRRDAVISGSALFSRAEDPAYWVTGLPALPEEKRGQVVPVSETSAAYLAADGGIYLSADRGRTWRGSRWRPWGTEPSVLWSFGTDYGLDLPLGSLDDPLPVAWFDRRDPAGDRLLLTTLSADGTWHKRAELPPEVLADTGQRLELVHLLRTGGGVWVMLSDCFRAGDVPGVAMRTYSLAGLSAPRFLPIR